MQDNNGSRGDDYSSSLRAAKPHLLHSKMALTVKVVTAIFSWAIPFLITAVASFSVLLILIFMVKDSVPFFIEEATVQGSEVARFSLARVTEFFADKHWEPNDGQYGSLAIFYGSFMVTFCSLIIAVPLGVAAAVCLSDVLPFWMRQAVKPVIEVLAAIPSVAYGFFAILVLAPLLQNQGGLFLAVIFWAIGLPVGLLLVAIASSMLNQALPKSMRNIGGILAFIGFGFIVLFLLYLGGSALYGMKIPSGANAFNVSLVLAVMVLPTIVSVSEDALQAVGREMREGAYALGSTRAETILKVILPAASSGVLAAVILGAMRAIGETMVVLMAAGNAANIPEPWYSLFQPIKTLTATIAGEMGEAPRGTPSYYVLFAMGMCLLVFSLVCNLISEWVLRRQRALLKGA